MWVEFILRIYGSLCLPFSFLKLPHHFLIATVTPNSVLWFFWPERLWFSHWNVLATLYSTDYSVTSGWETWPMPISSSRCQLLSRGYLPFFYSTHTENWFVCFVFWSEFIVDFCGSLLDCMGSRNHYFLCFNFVMFSTLVLTSSVMLHEQITPRTLGV